MDTQKERLKNNDGPGVLNQLTHYVEAGEVANDQAPVRACFRYLSNRPAPPGLPRGARERLAHWVRRN